MYRALENGSDSSVAVCQHLCCEAPLTSFAFIQLVISVSTSIALSKAIRQEIVSSEFCSSDWKHLVSSTTGHKKKLKWNEELCQKKVPNIRPQLLCKLHCTPNGITLLPLLFQINLVVLETIRYVNIRFSSNAAQAWMQQWI